MGLHCRGVADVQPEVQRHQRSSLLDSLQGGVLAIGNGGKAAGHLDHVAGRGLPA